jgi:hypothetical protein
MSRVQHASQWNTDRFRNSCTDMPPQCASRGISNRSARLPVRAMGDQQRRAAQQHRFRGLFCGSAPSEPRDRLHQARDLVDLVQRQSGAGLARSLRPLPASILYALIGTIKKRRRILPRCRNDGGILVACSCSARSATRSKEQELACRRSATAEVKSARSVTRCAPNSDSTFTGRAHLSAQSNDQQRLLAEYRSSPSSTNTIVHSSGSRASVVIHLRQ